MNGYSVDEAAEVLGIPQGRVWELIARGVLSGAAEGDGSMRVYLKNNEPAGISESSADGEAGNGSSRSGNGTPHSELSPFRELLTEFRNLTERYGQALLALGEARGEVASLRSRVDLLEARMDMRLPVRPSSTIAWEMPDMLPAPPAPAADEAGGEGTAAEGPGPNLPEPTESTLTEEASEAAPVATPGEEPAAADTEAVEPTEAEQEHELQPTTEPRPRRWSSHLAVANLAEALARADDPALSALPGAREAVDALAALQQQVEESSDEPAAWSAQEAAPAVDADLPSEVDDGLAAAAAPAIEIFDEPELPADVQEPESSEPEAGPGDEPELPADVQEPESSEPEAAPGEPEAAPGDESLLLQPEPAQVDEPPSPYSTDVIEPDWFADGDFSWLDAAGEEQAPEPEMPEPEVPEPEAPAAADAEAGDRRDDPTDEADDRRDDPTDEADDRRDDATDEADDRRDDATDEADDHAERGGDMASPTATPAEAVAEEIQEAFDEPDAQDEPPDASAQRDEDLPRTEAIHIEVDSTPIGRNQRMGEAQGIRSDEGAAGFGLFRGQPDAPVAERAAGRGSTAVRDEEALLWFGDEFEASDLEVAAPGWRDEERHPARSSAPVAPIQLSDSEIEQLASTEGWDPGEVDALRGLLGRQDGPGERPPEQAQPAGATSDAASAPEPAPDDRPVPLQLPIRRPLPVSAPDQVEQEPEWLHARRGPAATAYRRLRRLFQG